MNTNTRSVCGLLERWLFTLTLSFAGTGSPLLWLTGIKVDVRCWNVVARHLLSSLFSAMNFIAKVVALFFALSIGAHAHITSLVQKTGTYVATSTSTITFKFTTGPTFIIRYVTVYLVRGRRLMPREQRRLLACLWRFSCWHLQQLWTRDWRALWLVRPGCGGTRLYCTISSFFGFVSLTGTSQGGVNITTPALSLPASKFSGGSGNYTVIVGLLNGNGVRFALLLRLQSSLTVNLNSLA